MNRAPIPHVGMAEGFAEVFCMLAAQDAVFFNKGGIDVTEDLNAALDQLKSVGHKISAAFIGASGDMFVVVDDVAMKPADAIRLADGDVTLEELKGPDSE